MTNKEKQMMMIEIRHLHRENRRLKKTIRENRLNQKYQGSFEPDLTLPGFTVKS
ncbi:MAG TPA: hypothetical protein VLQ91_06775 [Draconibacterium sp.]|nr:hypothetical protein [Draconibacterium sp.]